MVHKESPQSGHHDKMNKQDIILKIRDTVAEIMQNPFDTTIASDKLINMSIATGETLASTQLVEAKRLGLESMTAASTTDAAKINTPTIMTFATQQKQGKKKHDSVKQLISEESMVTAYEGSLLYTRTK